MLDPVLDPKQNLSMTHSTMSSDEDDEESKDGITDLEDVKSAYSLKEKASKRFSQRHSMSNSQRKSAASTPSSKGKKRMT